MKKLVVITLLLILNSCFTFREKGVGVQIKNNSSEAITNIKFTTTEKIEVIEIEKIAPNETVIKFLSMKNNKSDGEYIVNFIRSNGENEMCSGGYYTNGGLLEGNWVDYIVENDTTIVKSNTSIF